jgi:putative transposase
MVSMLNEQDGYPVSSACKLLELPHSTYYYRAVEVDEGELEVAIEEIAGQFPAYGTRRVAKQLRRPPYELKVNRKHVRRIMAKKKLLRHTKRRKRRTTDSQHPYPRYPNLVRELGITRPDQVWVSDITYIGLHQEHVYLAIIMDVYTRTIRGWCLSRTLDQRSTTVTRASSMPLMPIRTC